MKIFTIGFTKTSAEFFFTRLQEAGVNSLVDIRLNNVSQLSGFAKKDDLPYFLKVICGTKYEHRPELAPAKAMLDAYKKNGGDWSVYEKQFLELVAERKIENCIPREALDSAYLLCSEDKPNHCHRRLVAEYLKDKWHNVEIHHL